MKKIFIKEDLHFAKIFINYPYPKFVCDLNLDMEIDYLIGICTRFLNKDTFLEHKIIDIDKDTKELIKKYLDENGDENDVIYYLMMQIMYVILKKYYNYNGYLKRELF